MSIPSSGLVTGLLLALLSLVPVHADDTAPTDTGALTGLLAARGYDTVPMRRYGAAHLAVEVRINGVAGTFLIDTGAGRTVIDRARQARFADGRQADASGGLQATGAGAGNLAIETLPGSRLAIGDYRDDDFTAHFLALDHVTAAFSQRGLPTIDGVLGADVLERGQAVIDYPNLRLHLRNPAASAASVSH
ncbi:retroviral-like aspartic protease family protein [Luteimonas sp. S4-F44]|uniref:retropepsin-like aspartic protease n=1 Tax=Luteimonas sp. S4-F44 TaxID=2925842 RepID=UPI001F533DA6|nr:retropepsin-like aspartic protease [Luteimonas sp. S4-F44]UNK43814.1 retroviral-like aspartic protease family protein [Luteimonas sp. S4-F44]